MFTVCPKCALTLVVTAADLRVAQGYVRCGRCSNVFNALARLSEDRTGAVNAAQAQASAARPAPTPPKSEVSGTFGTRSTPEASTTAKSDAAAARAAQDSSASAKLRQAPPPAPAPTPAGQDAHASQAMHPPEPKRYDDDSILEEDLEFKPDATDINKVFVEQPPSPKFTAATGTFQTLKLEAESAARAAEDVARTGDRKPPAEKHFEPADTQVDVEIDSDLLAEITGNRLQRLAPPPPETESPKPAPPAKPAAPPAKPTLMLQRAVEQPPQPPAPMPLAARAKARAEAKSESKRATALETAEAIRDALLPRKHRPLHDTGTTAGEQPNPWVTRLWAAGSVVLILLLLVQIVHHYRHDLAANATLNGPLTSIYAALGIPIVPRWDLTAYEVRQLGASTAADAPGQITVRASVKNGAHQAQPLPLLRVTLQDRFGNRIASRDVPPQSYLPRAIPPSARLSAGQRIDAEMVFVDPGANAVGFEIDACLPAPGGGISCANDAAR